MLQVEQILKLMRERVDHPATTKELLHLLRVPREGENIVHDYRSLGFSLGRHPLALLRPRLEQLELADAGAVSRLRHGDTVGAAGLVINRQQIGRAHV